MRFTGERVIPDRYELKPMLLEHLVRYEFALLRTEGADVLDLGCGCGYGTHMLATRAGRSAVGVDVSREAIDYCRTRYREPNLSFEVMDVKALGFPDKRFSAVVCLEVFEHVENQEILLKEAFRVLAPGGVLILSTPNKLVWSPGRRTPINPWHVREFDRGEFGAMLESRFPRVEYWTQTNPAPGVIPFILANLRLQGYYMRSHSPAAKLVELLHATAMKVAMLPPRIIPGAMAKNPNVIVPEKDVPDDKKHYFVAVARKG
jgi:SAM-dependent methyltransferase